VTVIKIDDYTVIIIPFNLSFEHSKKENPKQSTINLSKKRWRCEFMIFCHFFCFTPHFCRLFGLLCSLSFFNWNLHFSWRLQLTEFPTAINTIVLLISVWIWNRIFKGINVRFTLFFYYNLVRVASKLNSALFCRPIFVRCLKSPFKSVFVDI